MSVHPPHRKAPEDFLLPGDCALEDAIEQLLKGGCACATVLGPDGVAVGTFALGAFLSQVGAGASWRPEDTVLAHPQPRTGDAGAQTLATPWGHLLQLVLAGASKPSFGILDAKGRVLFGNAPLRAAFTQAFARPGLTLSELFPGQPGFGGPESAPFSSRVVHHERKTSLVLLARPQEGPERGFGAFAVFDLSAQLAQGHQKALDEVSLLKRVLDTAVDALMLVDLKGIITLVNRSFLEVHGITRLEAEGHPVTDVIENTRMHIVARTGVAEVDDFQEISGHEYVVSRIPLYEEGRCLGAVGKIVFKDFVELNRLAVKVRQLQAQLEALRATGGAGTGGSRFTFDDLVALSESSRFAKERAMLAAPTSASVLLLGESGVGKEVYAHAIHHLSARSQRPFVRVNCSALTGPLLTSQGEGSGGGPFAAAQHGTLFLDEIGDLPLAAQAELLGVLQERELGPGGGAGASPIDVRVIAATHQDLGAQVARGAFRKDLFYRLNVIPILIPPLRERPLDVPELMRLFWEDLQRTQGLQHKRLTEQAKALLQGYAWPGNVRELRNVLERTLSIVREDLISEDQVRMILVGLGAQAGTLGDNEDCPLEAVVAKAEQRAIGFALARANNNRLQAAKLLGISRPLLYRKMHQYDLF